MEGTLTADEGDFINIFVIDETTISEFLTSEQIQSKVLDATELYTNYIYPSSSSTYNEIYVYGTLIIEDPEEDETDTESETDTTSSEDDGYSIASLL